MGRFVGEGWCPLEVCNQGLNRLGSRDHCWSQPLHPRSNFCKGPPTDVHFPMMCGCPLLRGRLTYTHTLTHAHILHIHAYAYMCLNSDMCTHKHPQILTCTYTCMHKYLYSDVYTLTCAHMHTCIHTILIYTHIHWHLHIHMCMVTCVHVCIVYAHTYIMHIQILLTVHHSSTHNPPCTQRLTTIDTFSVGLSK